jgi:GDP-L-fucose synthase
MIKNKFFLNKKVFVAGHAGMVGHALIKKLKKTSCRIITVDKDDLDLREQKKVKLWFRKNKPDYVFLLAAKVGGIHANNTYPADFIYDNLMIQTNVIYSSFQSNVKKLLFLGSSCIYPKNITKKIKEEDLLSGSLEETNKAYAIAKISGLQLIESLRKQYKCNFISAMPTNIYGPFDNFSQENSHVFPALIKKINDAKFYKQKEIILWGNGKAKREFLISYDVADALVFLMEKYNDNKIINIGANRDYTIHQLTKYISKVLKYNVKIKFDSKYPNGVMRKKLCTKKINKMGWYPKTSLYKGIKITSTWYKKNYLDTN